MSSNDYLVVRGEIIHIPGYETGPLSDLLARLTPKHLPAGYEVVIVDDTGRVLDQTRSAQEQRAILPVVINLRPGEAA